MARVLKLCLAASALTAAASTARAADDPLTFRGSLSWLNVVEHSQVDEHATYNLDNGVLDLPTNTAVSELRPNLKLSTSNIQLIARPRVRYQIDQAIVRDEKRDAVSKTSSTLNEGFVQWTLNEAVTFVYGLQSYQWGATESMTPSNRIFHETAQQRDVLYEVRGKNIARVNFSIGKSFSTVVMGEVKENKDEPAFVAQEDWQPSALVKSEFSWHEGADYVGLVAGGHQHGQAWVGEYLSYGLPFFDGLTMFGDVAQQRGSDAWYPVAIQAPVPGATTHIVMEQSRKDEKKTENIAVGGLKYDFVNGSILRGEYIFNQPGYSKSEHDLTVEAGKAKDPNQYLINEQNLPRLLNPGLELPGQRYGYASLHVPDFLTVTDLTFDTRATYALLDKSSSWYTSADYKVGDSGTLSGAVAWSKGSRDSELKGFTSPTEILAYRHDW